MILNTSANKIIYDTRGLTEQTSLEMLERFERHPITTQYPGNIKGRGSREVVTNIVQGGDRSGSEQGGSGRTPLLLLHGFDSSLLEFRRLMPKLTPTQSVYAMDMLGFGFTDRPQTLPINQATIKAHLYGFVTTFIQKPVVLVGASMGGAAAIDFALIYPDWVKQLVLIDTVGWQPGSTMGRFLIPPLGYLATAFLANLKVRQKISEQAYSDRSFASQDAQACAALHLKCDRWREALISFTQNNGYGSFRSQMPQLTMPTLLLWGKEDRILGIKDTESISQAIPNCQLKWIERCGHVPHLEKSTETADLILNFLAPS